LTDKKKKFILINLIVVGALALVAAALLTAILVCRNSLPHENAAKRFSAGKRFAQITLFIPESEEYTIDKVMYFRYKLEKKLTENSIEETGGKRNYFDAYSLIADSAVSTEKKSSSAKVIYIGGDYSKFHVEFESLPDITNDVNHDRVLISRSAAWKMYGGSSLYDFPIKVDGFDCLISGTFEDYSGKEYEEYYAENPPIVADLQRVPYMPITCYEIVLVNPVNGFANKCVSESLDLQEGTYVMVENSSRFSFVNLYKNIPKLLSYDENVPAGVVLPPEELAARKTEKTLTFLTLLFTIFIAYPALWAVIYIIKGIRFVKKLIDKLIIGKIKDKLSYS
jgi:hypothetical protein